MTEKVLVTPAELSEMLKSEAIVLIDSRSPASYAAGHLPGAVNIHEIFTYLAMSTPEGVAAMRDKFAAVFGAAGLSGKETAVVYEQSMDSGFGQSCRGYVLLRYLGYPRSRSCTAAMPVGRRRVCRPPRRCRRRRRRVLPSIRKQLASSSTCRA